MSYQYDNYLELHKRNVVRGFEWIKENLPQYIPQSPLPDEVSTAEWNITFGHDASKNSPEEYAAYDAYFYGGNRSWKVVNDFRLAWLHHIHHNPHHWQHWVLVNDDPEEGTIALDMPYHYILEMICDWWSFSWSRVNPMEIFDWYEKHRENMVLSKRTRNTVETILEDMRRKLEERKLHEEA